jgi:prolyl 4-hydroxylase
VPAAQQAVLPALLDQGGLLAVLPMPSEDLVPDQSALAILGDAVRTRLSSMPDFYRVADERIELFAVGDFLTGEECARLCAMIDAVARPSALHELDYASGFRTSYSGDLDPRDPFVAGISARIDALLGVPQEIGEPVQG